MISGSVIIKEFTHFHLFAGLGGGAKGFNKGTARVGEMQAKFRCIGGIDNDEAAIRDFSKVAGVPGTVLDMFDYEQYVAFHQKQPPAGWREAMPADIRAAAGGEFPNIVFLSAPCKGFSGLLSETSSKTAKYQALNRLTLRGVWLTLEAFKDSPPELFIFENVPRIMKRGRALLDQIGALLRSYGYEVAETTHDCGEIGGLGQSRKRFLLVARLTAKVPGFLYQPDKHRLRGVGEILSKFPLPGDLRAGPMHRVPALQWKTWIRLAFVEAGSDWRSLNKLNVEDGFLKDFGILPTRDWRDAALVADPRLEEGGESNWHRGVLGVRDWSDTSGVVTGRGSPTTGAFSVADPRPPEGSLEYQQYGVREWDKPSGSVINVKSPGQGTFSVADPRAFTNVFRVVPLAKDAAAVADPRATGEFEGAGKYKVTSFDDTAGTIIAASTTGQGAFALADPRMDWGDGAHGSKLAVKEWDETAGAVTGARFLSGGGAVADPRPGKPSEELHGKFHVTPFDSPSRAVIGGRENGAFIVADPRPVGLNANREHYVTGGHYGVVPWEGNSGAIPGYGKYDRGPWSVADPRGAEAEPMFKLPEPSDRLVAVIRAMDGTWHRPFTTLELAALQSLVDPDEVFSLDGNSDSAWRERIGNAVPPDAAAAIAGVMGTTLLLAMTGQTFSLSAQPIWVQPIAMALAVDQRGNIPHE